MVSYTTVAVRAKLNRERERRNTTDTLELYIYSRWLIEGNRAQGVEIPTEEEVEQENVQAPGAS